MANKVFLVGILAVTACVENPDYESFEGEREVSSPAIVGNSLTPSVFGNSRLDTGVLDATSAAVMGATKDGRSVLAFAVGCALSPSQSITYSVGGTTYSAPGLMGVAPSWTTTGLSANQAAWVSACVISRVNVSGTFVQISARGEHAGYDSTLGELADFEVEEGAFWGNAFVDRGAVAGFACNGVDQAAGDLFGDLPLRECAEPDGLPGSNRTPCGLYYAGLCTTACNTHSPSYSGCSAGGATSNTVVTAFLYGLAP